VQFPRQRFDQCVGDLAGGGPCWLPGRGGVDGEDKSGAGGRAGFDRRLRIGEGGGERGGGGGDGGDDSRHQAIEQTAILPASVLTGLWRRRGCVVLDQNEVRLVGHRGLPKTA